MVGRPGRVASGRERAGARGRHAIAKLRDVRPDLRAVRLLSYLRLRTRMTTTDEGRVGRRGQADSSRLKKDR